uniref:BED-type domain-containing protein n=1 Tax=Cajanus cajan TaxID=3821 RepID=A0A151TAR1_CAJCA|nr:hypothetical protein KK1_018705 [Cajanus cajan]
MSTANASDSDSNINSKIPSKFISDDVVQDDHAPLWCYVSILDKNSEGGGNKSWSCNFCQKVFRSSYSRVKAHLLRIYGTGISVCASVNDQYLVELKSIVELAENKVKPKHVPLPTEKMHQSSLLEKRKVGPLEKAFNLENRDNLKALIARMFYSFGLPFNLARNPYYVNSYSFAANHMLNGFLPPGYNALRTTLLQQEKAHVERLLKPIKSTWNAKGVSIVSDGWTDVQRRPLINFMATSEGGPIFLQEMYS